MFLATFVISLKAFVGNSVALPRTHCLLFQALCRIRKHAEFAADCLSISNHTYVYTHVTSSANQGCTNPGHQAFWASKFCTVATNICLSSAWSSIHMTLPAPRTFRWLLDTWKVCAHLRMSY
jgi:hypothetical protein